MKYIKIFVTILLIISLNALLTGCSDDKSNDSSNRSPVITSLTANPDSNSVDLGQTSTLTVTATDPDGDPLTIHWDASAGSVDPDTGTTITWTAPMEVMPSAVTVSVSDGNLTAAESYTFYYDDFAALVGSPTIETVNVISGIARIVSPSTQVQRWLQMYAKVTLDATPASDIIWLTAEASNGTVYYLRDDGSAPDITADDNEYYTVEGGANMDVDEGPIPFIATNKYAKNDTMIFNLASILSEDAFPTMVFPDTNHGEFISDDIIGYFSGTPEFVWEEYSGADYFQVALTDTTYHFYIGQPDSLIFWMPPALPGVDTSVVYNYDNSAVITLFELADYDLYGEEYLFHLIVNINDSWARREVRIRRVQQ